MIHNGKICTSLTCYRSLTILYMATRSLGGQIFPNKKVVKYFILYDGMTAKSSWHASSYVMSSTMGMETWSTVLALWSSNTASPYSMLRSGVLHTLTSNCAVIQQPVVRVRIVSRPLQFNESIIGNLLQELRKISVSAQNSAMSLQRRLDENFLCISICIGDDGNSPPPSYCSHSHIRSDTCICCTQWTCARSSEPHSWKLFRRFGRTAGREELQMQKKVHHMKARKACKIVSVSALHAFKHIHTHTHSHVHMYEYMGFCSQYASELSFVMHNNQAVQITLFPSSLQKGCVWKAIWALNQGWPKRLLSKDFAVSNLKSASIMLLSRQVTYA